MKKSVRNIFVQIARVLFAAPVGILTVNYFKIDNSAFKIIYFFGVYILVSIIIEVFLKIFENQKNTKG